jgi:ABC-type molybdate transport system permease subunit
MPKLRENLKVLESQTEDVRAKVLAVVSSVVIAYVFTKHDVYLKSEQNEVLLKCLWLPPDEEVCCKFMKTINEFDNNILR